MVQLEQRKRPPPVDYLLYHFWGERSIQVWVTTAMGDREYDEVTEDFDYPAGVGDSREDGVTPLGQPAADWGDGILRASFDFGGTGGPGGDFDWVVGFAGPETVILDTVSPTRPTAAIL